MASVGYDKSQLNAVMKAAGTDTGNSFMRAFAGIVGGGGSGGGGGMATKAGQGGGNLLSGGLTSPVGIAGIIAAGLTSLPFIAETAAAGIVTAFGGALTAMGALGAFGTGSATPAQVKAGQNALQLAQLRLQNAQAAKNPNAATVLSAQNSVTAAQSNLTALKNNELSPGQQQVRNSFKSLSQSAQGDLSKIGVSFIPVMQSIFNTANGVLGKLTPVFASATRVISGPFKVFSDTIIKAFGSPEVKLSIAAVAGSFGKLLGALTPQIGPDINQLALAIARIANTIAAHPQDFASFVRFLVNVATGALDTIDWLTKVAQYITEHFGPALHHIANVFDGVRHEVAHIWDMIYQDTIGNVIRISHNVEAELDRMHKQIASVFDTIRHDVAHYWDLIFQATIGTVIRLVGNVDKNLGDLKTNIGRWISDVRNDITGGWNNILHDTTQILGKIVNWVESNFIRPVKNAFSQFVSELPGIWNKIQDIVEKPVKFIVNTVYDGGIARFWNDVASPLHLPKLPLWHLAGGGPVIGPGSATSDSVPVMASHGEFMINAAAAKAIGTENLHALNSVASSGGRSYNAAGTAYRAAGGSIVAQAETYRGHPYVWGGPANPRGGFDCSSFVGMILGMNGITLPGGVKWNPNAHGPVASSYASWPLQAYSSMSPGDLYVEQNGGHVGFVTGPGQGFAAIGRNFGTNFQSVPDSLYNIHQIPGVSGAPGGLGALVNKAGQLVKGAEGLLATATADIMTGAMHALINPLIKKIPGTDSGIGAMVAQMPSALVAALAAKIKSANPNAMAPGGVFSGNPMGGVTGSDMANGKELYLYLKQNLFGGNKIAAAGATASIWGECLTLDNAILTRRGWLKHDEVRPGDETIGYNAETGKSEWTTVMRVVHYEQMPVVTYGNQYWNATFTPSHRWVTQPVNRDRFYDESGHRRERMSEGAIEVKPWAEVTSNDRLILSVPARTGGGLPISDKEAALLGWISGDGHVAPSTGQVSVYQSKPEHFEHISSCLPEGEFGVSVRTRTARPEHTWHLHAAYSRDLLNRAKFSPKTQAFELVLAMSDSQREAWLDAIYHAEGSARTGGKTYYQNPGNVADAIELAVYLSGKRPGVCENNRGSLSITDAAPYVGGFKRNSFSEDAGIADVWCVTTGLGTWTARNESGAFLTGNSGWNPFAQGTGGRGLIGWTPPGKISNAVFSGGMKTQLPAILQFVTSNGDLGVVSQMFRSTSVFDAANLWGRGVERFGINDVHPQGVALASSFMKFAKGTDGAPPGWAWVGEQGPELVNMVGGETVLDHHTSMGIGGSFPGYAKGTAQAKAQAKARAAAARNVTAERRTGNSIISALAASFSGGGLPSSGQINSDLSAALKAITVYYSGGKAKNLETQLQKQADSMHTMLAKYTAVEANLAAGRAYATSVTSSLVGYSDLSGLGAVPASGSGKGFGSSIVNNLNLRLTALKNFNNLLKAAAGKGISATFLQQAIALGPDGGTQYLQAMLSGGSGLIKTVNEIEKQTTAVEATIGQNAANIVYSPSSMGKGFLTGLTSQAAGLDKAMQNLGHTFAVSVAKDLRIPIKSLPHFAAGGIAQAGTLAMVGENGPELVRFNQTGTVYNAQRTAKMSQPQPQPDVSINFYGPQYPTPEQIANLKLEFSKQMAGYNL
jgi:cell wall-associated NlpC family hydrolase